MDDDTGGVVIMELWLWEKKDGHMLVEIKEFSTCEEAKRFAELNRNGRNMVFVENAYDRDNVLRLVGANVID